MGTSSSSSRPMQGGAPFCLIVTEAGYLATRCRSADAAGWLDAVDPVGEAVA